MILRGTVHYARILGRPHDGYKTKDPKEQLWSMDFSPDDAGLERLRENGLFGKLKNKGDDRGFFLTFRRRAFNLDENKQRTIPAKPIRVIDRHKEPWPEKTRIGNGSTANVNFATNDRGDGNVTLGLIAVQIWDLIPYEGGNDDYEDFPVDSDGNESWDNT